jgi:hypothetical protein
MMAKLAAFLGDTKGSIKGVLCWQDLKRSIVLAATSSTVLGLALTIIQYTQDHLADLVDPKFVGVTTALLVLLADAIRRQANGVDPAKLNAYDLKDQMEAISLGKNVAPIQSYPLPPKPKSVSDDTDEFHTKANS